ncbi:hypothetical protein VPH35_086170 [Triticum aestivum]
MEEHKTVSICTTVADQGTQVFDIMGYSKHRGMGNDEDSHIRSGIFAVGGYDWAIHFYPDGNGSACPDYISVFLDLLSNNAKARASCDLRIFNSNDVTKFAPQFSSFKRRSKIEDSAYLLDDRLSIKCIITVFKKPHVTQANSVPQIPKIDMPPSDMTENVGRLLEKRKGYYVRFIVGGEIIEAHRFVLAMRSPVLKVELYGPMREERPGKCINIKDMQPAIFRALLHFFYTDSLPGSEDRKGGDDTEMVRLLLVAADRYAMERLKMVYQSILCKDLNAETVDAGLEFIKILDENVMDAVVATQGFKDLNVTCPSLIVEALEKRRKFRKA